MIVKRYFLDQSGSLISKSALILMLFILSGLLIAQLMPQSLPGALAVFASPIQASCYQPKPDSCRIHVEPYTINIAPGSHLVQFQLVATRIGIGTNTIIYDFRPDQSNPIPYSGTTYTPSLVAMDYAATCGKTYTISLLGRDTSDLNLFALGTTGQFTCPVDTTYPTVIRITRLGANPNNSATVQFSVIFSELVTGVDVSDFTISKTGVSGASITGISGSGSSYTVTVKTGNGSGTLRLNVVDNNSIVDAVSNPLGGAVAGDGSFVGGETYSINKGGDTTGVFRPGNGLLYLKNANTSGFADVAINYGLGGDYPVAGDWDGNGTATIGVYRNGSFYLRNSNTLGFADIVVPFGTPGDQPVVGDWNGDGVDTIGVYSNGQFLLRNSNSAGTADVSFYLGNPGDVGIAGDWNGDGSDTTGVFRPSNGVIFLKNLNTSGFADININYGLSGDKPVTGDWNSDGIDTIGVYRNAQFLLRNSNTIGFADIVFALGNPGDMPISGNWDGIP